ncbi:MAG: selenocysteine-specific translation elongation factor [Desulfobulbus propionicus]|nr:MAG: selenocysteine-specific translation elongation factor [Desulfobulbus propionicus]
MRELILGTAGHVDHGKTSLIKALTGIETDRLKEEKKRGITIELGFAHLDLPCGHRLGIVDVPGHEKFVRNMVAGAAGMDLVAFIIAADEGIMPQTIEHFDICRLLGISNGLIILTKKDVVEAEWLEMVEEEIRDFFTDSFLEQAPVIAVSSVTGEGIDQVIKLLDNAVKDRRFQEEFGPFRLSVDRVFTMKGFGTVATGTSISGRIKNGDEVTIYPGQINARIRGIQVHGNQVEVVEAGHRTAINLQGVEKEQLKRGDVLATPESLISSTLLDASLVYLESTGKELKNRVQVRVHLGTREIKGRVLLMEKDRLPPGSQANIQLLLQEPVAVWPGDRYVLRSFSPVQTIGGGKILNALPAKRKRRQQKDREYNTNVFSLLESGTPAEKVLLLLKESKHFGITADQLAARTGVFGKKLQKLMQQPVSSAQVLVIDSENKRFLAAEVFDSIKKSAINYLAEFHRKNPLKPGIHKDELRTRLRPLLDVKLFQFTLNSLLKAKKIEQEGAVIKLAGYTVVLQMDEQKMEKNIAVVYQKAGLTPPNYKDVLSRFSDFSQEQLAGVYKLLQGKGALVKVNEALYFDAQAIEKLKQELIDFVRKEGEIDAPRFKELTGLTRKYSIPLLEYFDKSRITIRVGDKRILRKT